MPLQLRTLGTPSLTGPNGAIALDEPRLVALVVLLAAAGDAGVLEDDLLLRLTPDAKPAVARAEVARLVAVARLRLGGESSMRDEIDGAQKRYLLAPGLIDLDVRLLDRETVECSDFLRDFSVPGSPEFREWLAATRRRVAPKTSSRPREPGPSRRKVLAGVIGVVVAVVIASIAATAASRARVPTLSGFSVGDPLLLADIQNETGDTIFDRSLSSAAEIALQQSGRLRLYPRTRLPGIYRLMRIANPDTQLTFELSKQVALRDAVRFVVGLRIARDGDRYVVDARVADVSVPNRVVETRATAHDRNDVLRALDDVLAGVRRALGESRAELRDRREPLPLVTTTSLEALRSYADGSSAWAKGDYRLASELWQRGIDLDTGFAMAYTALAQAFFYAHQREPTERYLDAAFRHRDRLSEWELLRLEQLSADFRGLPDSAVFYAGRIAERFPSAITWYNYGTSLMNESRYAPATAALRTALTFDSTHTNSWINLATIAKREDRSEEALRYYAAAARVDSAVLYRNNVNGEWGSTLVALNRYAEAESAFTRMASSASVGDRALGLRSLGSLALWQGRLDDAIGFYRRAVDAATQTRASLSEMRARLMLAAAYRAEGREGEAAAETARALSLATASNFEPQALVFVATACIKSGRLDGARAMLAEMRKRSKPGNPVDSSAEAYVLGLLALATNHPDSAIRESRGAGLVPNLAQLLLIKAEAFRMLGQLDSARAAIDDLRKEHVFGTESEEDWLHAPLVLGDILVAQGDTAGATRQYQALVDQWRAAPPTAGDLVAARTRLASLRGTLDRGQARQAGVERKRP